MQGIGQCEEYTHYETIKTKHILHTTNIGMCVHIIPHIYVRTGIMFQGKMSKHAEGGGAYALFLGGGGMVKPLSPI